MIETIVAIAISFGIGALFGKRKPGVQEVDDTPLRELKEKTISLENDLRVADKRVETLRWMIICVAGISIGLGIYSMRQRWLRKKYRLAGESMMVRLHDLETRPNRQAHEQIIEDLRSNPLCVVCFERDRSELLVPCHHFCLCSTCNRGILLCPICRSDVRNSVHIYLS